MNLSKDQVNAILNNAPSGVDKTEILDGLVSRGYSLEGVDMNQAQARVGQIEAQKTIETDQFEAEPSKGFFEKARDVTVGFLGGGKLAEGLGQAIAAPKVQAGLDDAFNSAVKIETDLMKKIRQRKAEGADTARLESALTQLRSSMDVNADAQKDFTDSLVTDKEVIGSALRLAGTFAGPKIGAGVASKVGGAGTGVVEGVKQGAKIGAATGVIEGGIHGAGVGLEQNKDAAGIAGSAIVGSALGGVTGGVLGGAIGGVTGRMKANQEFAKKTEELLTTKPDSTVAKYKLEGSKVVNDPLAKEAIKQGFDEGNVSIIKGASTADKSKFSKAVDILEKGQTDPKYKAVNRPSDVIGDSVLERFKVVNNANKAAGKQLDVVAKGLQGKQANPTPAVQAFIDDLDDLGVQFKNGKAVYSGSQIEGLKEPQKIIDLVVKRMNSVSDDAYEMHKLKKFIDEQVTFGKTSGGLTGRSESILKGLRTNLDDILDNTFTDYNQVNTTYATTRNAIDDFMTSAGSRFDPTAKNANARVGTLARRILSNAQSRTEVLNAMQNLQDVAEANGGKFADDIVSQTVFVNDLERMFGTNAPTSLAGEVTKGVQRAKTVTGKLRQSEGLFDLALDLGAEGIEKARGIDEEGAIKAIRALLGK